MSENELNDIKTAMLQAFPPEIQKRIQAIGQGMENLAQAEHDAAEKLR
jgi:hypothetical protein